MKYRNSQKFIDIINEFKKLNEEKHLYILSKNGNHYVANEITENLNQYLDYKLFQAIEMIDIFGKRSLQIILIE